MRKFWDKEGKYIEDGEPVYLSGKVIGGTPKFHASEPEEKKTSVFDDKESSISKMWKDKKMVKMIKNGKGSDKGIKAEAFAIERENANRPKEKWMKQKKEKLKQMKREFKIKG